MYEDWNMSENDHAREKAEADCDATHATDICRRCGDYQYECVCKDLGGEGGSA